MNPVNALSLNQNLTFPKTLVQEPAKTRLINFLSQIEKFNRDPLRLTAVHRDKLQQNANLSLGQLAGNLFWKTLSIPPKDHLERYRAAISELTTQVISLYCPHFEGILEIGAGYHSLVEGLSNISEKIKNRIHVSDIAPDVVTYLQKKNPSQNVLELDFTDLKSEISPETYQCIIMCDVLSVFIKDILDKSLQQAALVLKPGGFLMHFQMREIMDSSTIDSYSNSTVIIFPLLERATIFKEIYIIDKAEFLNRLYSLNDEDEVKKTLLAYYKMYPSEREEFCGRMLGNGANDLMHLIQCLRQLGCRLIKKINLNEDFISRTRDALEKNGFKIVKDKTKESTIIIDRKEVHQKSPHSSFFSINKGLRTESYMGVLSLGLVQEQAIAHVIVAQKL